MRQKSRQGMAVPVVLVFAVTLAILASFVIKSNSQNFQQNVTGLNQAQAHFIARAGMEHALVKVKYHHRELYDAACLSQGRNPLFNFGRPVDAMSNPGPKFAIHVGDASPNSFGFIADLSGLSSCQSPPAKWLATFRADLTSINTVMSMDPLPPEIRNRMRDPFIARYWVDAIDVLAQKVDEGTGQRSASDRVVVEIRLSAEMTTARAQKQGLPADFKEELKRTLRVARDQQ